MATETSAYHAIIDASILEWEATGHDEDHWSTQPALDGNGYVDVNIYRDHCPCNDIPRKFSKGVQWLVSIYATAPHYGEPGYIIADTGVELYNGSLGDDPRWQSRR